MPSVWFVDDDQKLLKMLQRTLVCEGLDAVNARLYPLNSATSISSASSGVTRLVFIPSSISSRR